MSSFSEQDSIDPDNPQLDYMPLGLSERAAKLGPLVSQGAGSERLSDLPAPKPATRALDRRPVLLSFAIAVAGVAAVTALLSATMRPASRELIGTSTPPELTGSLAELKAPVPSSPSQPTSDEQSPQLLQGFLQWREKATTTAASQ